jgi:flagellar biosynthesis protein FlhF
LAAVEQLSKFAEILEAPINIALNAADLHNAISFHKDRSLILIDTPGMSHRDNEKMNELKDLMAKEEDIERHFAISVTTKQKDIEEIISKFSIFKPSNIIFTKLDESSTYGNIYNQMVKSGIPISYITNGQNVPDDIEIARRDTLTDLLLPE